MAKTKPKGSGKLAKAITENPNVLEQIEVMAGIGLTVPQIAAVLGISKGAFYYTANEVHPGIIERLEAGRAKVEFKIGRALVNKASNGDMAAIRWYEMTRAGRSEKVESKEEHTHYVIEVPPEVGEDEWDNLFNPQQRDSTPTETE